METWTKDMKSEFIEEETQVIVNIYKDVKSHLQSKKRKLEQ